MKTITVLVLLFLLLPSTKTKIDQKITSPKINATGLKLFSSTSGYYLGQKRASLPQERKTIMVYAQNQAILTKSNPVKKQDNFFSNGLFFDQSFKVFLPIGHWVSQKERTPI